MSTTPQFLKMEKQTKKGKHKNKPGGLKISQNQSTLKCT